MSYHAYLGNSEFVVVIEKINIYNYNSKTNPSKLKLFLLSPTGYSYWVPGEREAQLSPKHHPLLHSSAVPTTQLVFGYWYSLMEMWSCIFSIFFLTFPLPPRHHLVLCHEHFVCLYEHRASELNPHRQLNQSQFGEKYRRLINC